MLKADNVTKSFGGVAVLKGVSMEIGKGIIAGIYGDSGSGKSTFAKILCGLISPDSGNAFFDGTPLYDDRGKYRRQVGLGIQTVYQQPFSVLDPSQRIRDGLEEIARCYRLSPRKFMNGYIDGIADEVELEADVLGHYPHQISGGEAQRIVLAKCLMFEPKVLILDEATSMLDASTQANLLSLVKRMTQTRGCSVLFISHDRELTDFYCDEVWTLSGGKLFKE